MIRVIEFGSQAIGIIGIPLTVGGDSGFGVIGNGDEIAEVLLLG